MSRIHRSVGVCHGWPVCFDAPDVMEVIQRVAPARVSVFITGETGTGKEVAARAIHDRSGRTGPFISVNCAAIIETLIESELFGHQKGSFTGADRRHPGLIERANGGTLFLDEISEMRGRGANLAPPRYRRAPSASGWGNTGNSD